MDEGQLMGEGGRRGGEFQLGSADCSHHSVNHILTPPLPPSLLPPIYLLSSYLPPALPPSLPKPLSPFISIYPYRYIYQISPYARADRLHI